jgi:adenosylcobinamide-phosphate synthase
MTVAVVGLSFALAFFLLKAFYRVNAAVGFIAEAALCYFCIAARGLRDEAYKIHGALIKNNLPDARKKLSWIVGRDTEHLSQEEIIKATVETVAENLSDGAVAPLIFMFIGGAALAMAYKAVNTLDSMVGYRNGDYEYLGKFAARLDDVVNFIPARISGVLMIVSAYLCGFDGKGAARVFLRDRKNHLSPNSAQTEAACAGALGIQLGGTHTYGGKPVVKPTIGDGRRQATPEDIKSAAKLMYASVILTLIIGAGLRLVLYV